MASELQTLLVVCVLGCMLSPCLSIQCLQCNMRQMGVTNNCKIPKLMEDCVGCMKTVTKVKIRDSGYITGLERVSNVTSRYCMRQGATNIRPEGCYKQLNNGGYTEKCFCYSNLCNTGSSIITPPSFSKFRSTALTIAFVLTVTVTSIVGL